MLWSPKVIFALLLVGIAGDSLALAGRPEILELRTCREVKETPYSFEARGWTSSFTAEDAFVYCVAKVRIPGDASWSAYRAQMVWYSPDGSEFRTDEFKDLERGYTWSLWGRLPIRGAPAASLLGAWKVVFSVTYGPSRSTTFTLSSSTKPDDGERLPSSVQVEGREQEPNDTAETANRLSLKTPVQGEIRHFSEKVFDQDWFVIQVSRGQRAWLVINVVGTTSLWVSPHCFLRLYLGEELERPGLIRWESRQERGEERSTCDVALPLDGPGMFYVRLSAKDCGYDLAYRIELDTVPPAWLED